MIQTIEDLEKHCKQMCKMFAQAPESVAYSEHALILSLIERNKGEWIENAEEWDTINPRYICSKCGRPELYKQNFCATCGCDMRR